MQCPYCGTHNEYRAEWPWCAGCGAPVQPDTASDYIVRYDGNSTWNLIYSDDGDIYVGGAFFPGVLS